MRVLHFNARLTVYLEESSSMTTDKLSEQIADELCMTADVPQACFVVNYAIRDISVAFTHEGRLISDDLVDENNDEVEDSN